jgi:hypothetical protein
MGVEFTQSGNDIIVREEPEDFQIAGVVDYPNDECIGCFRQTELVCPYCLYALCLDCRPGHTDEACVENQTHGH